MSPAADLTVSGGLLLTGNICQPTWVSLGWNEEHHWTFSVTEHSGRLCGCCQTGGVVQWRAVEVYWSLWIKWFMNLFVWESKSQRLTDRVCSVPCGLEIKTQSSARTLCTLASYCWMLLLKVLAGVSLASHCNLVLVISMFLFIF